MTSEEKPKRSRGRPRRYAPGKRPTLTFRVQEEMHQDIAAAAEASGKSISEEIEYRLNAWAAWKRTKADVDELLAKAKAAYDAAEVARLRAAGLLILREIEGRPTRVVIDLTTLLAEADGLARGLRSGFTTEPAPAAEPPRPRTAEEDRKLMEGLDAIVRQLDRAVGRTKATDAAEDIKSDDTAA